MALLNFPNRIQVVIGDAWLRIFNEDDVVDFYEIPGYSGGIQRFYSLTGSYTGGYDNYAFLLIVESEYENPYIQVYCFDPESLTEYQNIKYSGINAAVADDGQYTFGDLFNNPGFTTAVSQSTNIETGKTDIVTNAGTLNPHVFKSMTGIFGPLFVDAPCVHIQTIRRPWDCQISQPYHEHVADNVTLTLHVEVDETHHDHKVTFNGPWSVRPAYCSHTHEADSPALTVHVVVDNPYHTQYADTIFFPSCFHIHTSDTIRLYPDWEDTSCYHETVCDGDWDIELIIDPIAAPVVSGDMDLPVMDCEAYFGAVADLTLPALTMDAEIIQGLLISGDMTLPSLTMDAIILTGVVISAELTLPAFTMDAIIQTGVVISAELTLPALTMDASLAPDVVISGDFTMPAFIMDAYLKNAAEFDSITLKHQRSGNHWTAV